MSIKPPAVRSAEQAAPKAAGLPPLVRLDAPDYVIQPKDTGWKIATAMLKERGVQTTPQAVQGALDELKALNPELFSKARKDGASLFPGDHVRFPPKDGGWKIANAQRGAAPVKGDAAADMARLRDEATAEQKRARDTREKTLSSYAEVASKTELSPQQREAVSGFLKELQTHDPELLKRPQALALAEKLKAPVAAPAPAVAAPAAPAAADPSKLTLTEFARARMQEMEKDPNSSLNIKLRRAGIDKVAKPFSDSFPIIASSERLAGLPPERVKAAVTEAIEFATDLYVAHGGGPSPFLSTIELVPERADGLVDRVLTNDQLTLKTSGSLGIEVPKKKDHLSSESIHSQWDEGRQFDNDSLAGMWPLMNPVGPVQTTVRKVVGGAAEALGLDLDAIKKKLVDGLKDTVSSKASTEEARAQLKSLVNQQVAADVPGSDGKGSMRAAAHQVIDRASPQELARLVEAWGANAQNRLLQDSVTRDVIHTGIQQSPDVTNVALGLITVQNSKTINVQADATIGATSVKRFLGQQSGGGKIRQFSLSAIGINLHDSINVQATLTKLQDPTVRALAGVSLAKAFSI